MVANTLAEWLRLRFRTFLGVNFWLVSVVEVGFAFEREIGLTPVEGDFLHP